MKTNLVYLSEARACLPTPQLETGLEAVVGGEASEEDEDEVEDNQDSMDEDMASFRTKVVAEDDWGT